MIKVLTVIDQYWPFEGGAESLSRYTVELTNSVEIHNNVLTIAKNEIAKMTGVPLALQELTEKKYVINRFTLPRLFGKEKNGRFFRYVTLLKYIYHIITLRNQFDIIHAQTFYWPATASIIAGKLLQKPVIVTGHSTLTMLVDEIKRGRHPSLLLTMLKYADKYIAINNSIKYEATNIAQFKPAKVAVICNGIDTDKFQPPTDLNKKSAIRKRLDLPPQIPIIIYHGRFEDYKNIQTLLKALAAIRQEHTQPFLLLLLGNGPYRKQLELLSRDLNLTDCVSFQKFQHNVNEYLQAADIYCLPSYIEGLSLALLEAMASDLVCVASNIDGNREAIKDGINGFLFSPSQVGDLQKILIKQLKGVQTNRFDDIRKNAHDTVTNRFSLTIMAEQYISLYNSMA